MSRDDVQVSLKVYDILGREIATLVDEQKPAGNYEVKFNVGQASSLSGGVYFYQPKAMSADRQDGAFSETKKMILIK